MALSRSRLVAVAVVLLTALSAGVVALGVAAGVVPLPAGSPHHAGPAPVTRQVRSEVAAIRVLRAWDRRRAQAYAAGSAPRLRALYVTGSGAGTRDLALLRGYTRRGLRVEGLRMQLLSVTVDAHGTDRWRLTVTDRLTGGVAVGGRRGEHRLPLPHDTASTRDVALMRGGDGRWRVATVSPG